MEATFFPYIMAFAWMGLFLLIGTILRAKIKILQTYLIPSALIAGIIGFISLNAGIVGIPTSQGWKPIAPGIFGVLSFHLFAIGFVGIGLLQSKSKDDATSKTILRGSLWICLLFCMLWALQGMIGFSVFSLYKDIFGGDFFPGNGYLLGAGFTQGPGQSQAYGIMWEQSHSIVASVSTGLGFSAIGFLAAGLVGVPLALYGLKKGWCSAGECKALPNEFLVGMMERGNNPACAYATTHSANIDSFSFHVAIIAVAYGIAYLWSLAWALYMPSFLAALGFGMVFFWGMSASIIIRKVMQKTDCIHLLEQESVKRLTGITVDFMLCAVFMAITVSDLKSVVAPFFIASVLAILATLAVCVYYGRRTTEYGFERMVTLFGYCTGTAASGLLLLRIVDSEFETPVAVEVGFMNVWAFLFIKPISWSAPFVPVDGYPFFWILAAYILAVPATMLTLKLCKWKRVF